MSRPIIDLPLRSHYNDGSNEVTENKGSLGGTATLGDGTTTTRFPTQVSPHGVKNASGDFMQIPHADMPDLGNNFTLGFLVKATALTWGGIDKSTGGTSTVGPYSLGSWSGTGIPSLYVSDLSSSSPCRATTNVCDGAIHSLIATSSGFDTKIYVDGKLEGSVTHGLTLVNNTDPLIFGAMNTTPIYALIGTLYTPKVYSYALTASQIRKLHHDLIAKLNI